MNRPCVRPSTPVNDGVTRATTRLDPIDFLQQLCRRRPIRRDPAAMGEEDVARAIEQKITAGLIDIFSAVSLLLHPFEIT